MAIGIPISSDGSSFNLYIEWIMEAVASTDQ